MLTVLTGPVNKHVVIFWTDPLEVVKDISITQVLECGLVVARLYTDLEDKKDDDDGDDEHEKRMKVKMNMKIELKMKRKMVMLAMMVMMKY